MINYNNHNINKISYNNHSIKYVYGCGGNLVWSDIPTGDKIIYHLVDNDYGVECNGLSTLESQETYNAVSSSNGKLATGVTIGTCIDTINYVHPLQHTTNLTIPSNIIEIGYDAFNASYKVENDVITGIKNITFEEGIEYIKGNAFNECRNLENVVFPNSLKEIDSSALAMGTRTPSQSVVYQPQLKTITFGTGIQKITNSSGSIAKAFGGSQGQYGSPMEWIKIYATTPPTLTTWKAFDGTYPIYVPSSSLSTYKSASQWVELRNRIYPL